MTPQQYNRWQDFSMRMARTCFIKRRRPDAKWIERAVASFFTWLEKSDIPCIIDWDNSTDYPSGGSCYCVGDMMSEHLDEWRPSRPRCLPCSSWRHEGECRCDDIEDRYYDQWDEQWGGPIHCCIRAGLDCASAPSAGVVGFSAGDVRQMYPEGVPDWVFPPNERLHYWLSNEINGTFADLPDSAGVVL